MKKSNLLPSLPLLLPRKYLIKTRLLSSRLSDLSLFSERATARSIPANPTWVNQPAPFSSSSSFQRARGQPTSLVFTQRKTSALLLRSWWNLTFNRRDLDYGSIDLDIKVGCPTQKIYMFLCLHVRSTILSMQMSQVTGAKRTTRPAGQPRRKFQRASEEGEEERR